MRSFGVVVVAFLISGFVAGVVQLQLAIWYQSQEEFIVVMMAFALLVLLVAIAYGVALALSVSADGATRIALWTAGLLIVALATAEAYGAWQGGVATLTRDLPIVVEFLAPALLAILIQWWLVRRHILKRRMA